MRFVTLPRNPDDTVELRPCSDGKPIDFRDGYLRSIDPHRETPEMSEADLAYCRAMANAMSENNCKFCDSCGGPKTYKNQVPMPIRGKVVFIDACIAVTVAALNAGGVDTVASCCGHGKSDGRINLYDGRVLIIKTEAQ